MTDTSTVGDDAVICSEVGLDGGGLVSCLDQPGHDVELVSVPGSDEQVRTFWEQLQDAASVALIMFVRVGREPSVSDSGQHLTSSRKEGGDQLVIMIGQPFRVGWLAEFSHCCDLKQPGRLSLTRV